MLSNKKLIIDEIKRKSWVLVVLLLVSLVTGPLLMLINYENMEAFLGKEALIESMENYFARSGGVGAILCVISAVLLGLAQFSYLFYKNKVDLYHSIPVKRSRRFIVNYTAGLIVFLICSIASNVLMIIIVLSKGCFTSVLFSNLVLSFLSEIIHFLYFYNITIIAVMLTGNIVVCLMGTAILSLFYFVSTELITGLKNYYFVTSHSIRYYGEAFWNKFPELSPVTAYVSFNVRRTRTWGAECFENNLQAYGYLAKVLVVVILTTLLAYYLFEKRPSEAAGKAMAFKKSQPFIRIPVVLVGGLFGAAIMTSVVNAYKNGWIWFGLIFGMIITHCIMEIIYNLNFKAVANNKLQLIFTLAAGCIVLFIFQTDLFGFDKYIPERDKIESAAVTFVQLDRNLSCETLESVGEGIWDSIGKSIDEQALDNMFGDSVMIDKVYAIGALGVTCVDDMISNRYGEHIGEYYETAMPATAEHGADYETNQYFLDNNITVHEITEKDIDHMMTTDVIFKLKNGRTVIRRYDIPVGKIEMAMSEIYKTKEFKRVHFDLYDAAKKGAISTIEATDIFENKKMSLTGGQMKQFLEIYISELDKLTVNDLKQLPVGRIYPKYNSLGYESGLYGYYIYPCFTKTLAYMDSIGVDMTYFTSELDISKIQNMTISAYGLFERVSDEPDDYESTYFEDVTYNVSDENGKAMIDAVLDHIMPSGMVESNYCLTPYDGRLDIQIYYESENGIQMNLPCMLKFGELPNELLNDLKIKLYEQETGM